MSNRLTKGLYEPKPMPFGLQYGQKRIDHVLCRNAAWFNLDGERLGVGDLNHQDFYNIVDGLNEDEAFYVVPSYLDPDVAIWLSDDLVCADGPEGIDYIEDRARFVILRGKIMMVWRNDEGQSASWLRSCNSIFGTNSFSTIKPAQIAEIMISPRHFVAA